MHKIKNVGNFSHPILNPKSNYSINDGIVVFLIKTHKYDFMKFLDGYFFIVSTAIFEASCFGYQYTPVQILGKAMVYTFISTITIKVVGIGDIIEIIEKHTGYSGIATRSIGMLFVSAPCQTIKNPHAYHRCSLWVS